MKQLTPEEFLVELDERLATLTDLRATLAEARARPWKTYVKTTVREMLVPGALLVLVLWSAGVDVTTAIRWALAPAIVWNMVVHVGGWLGVYYVRAFDAYVEDIENLIAQLGSSRRPVPPDRPFVVLRGPDA